MNTNTYVLEILNVIMESNHALEYQIKIISYREASSK